MDVATRDLVRRRAAHRCEYCQLAQEHSELTHQVEHTVAKQHGGSDEGENLALACHRCNFRKGPNLTGIDPISGEVVALFPPRRDEWNNHLRLRGIYVEGLTPIGRATVQLLGMNDTRRLELRTELSELGKLP